MLLKKMVLLAAIAFVFPGCAERDLHINVRYEQILGLEKGNRLLFEQNEIGKVESVVYSAQGYYIVGLAVQKDFAAAATEHSRFFIITDPGSRTRKAVEMIQTEKGGTRLQEGALVEGSTKTSEVLNRLRDDLEKGAEVIRKHFEQFIEGLQRIPESEEMRNLRRELEDLAAVLKQSSRQVRDQIQREILPRLQQELERLKEEFKKRGREDDEELKDLETQLEEIEKI